MLSIELLTHVHHVHVHCMHVIMIICHFCRHDLCALIHLHVPTVQYLICLVLGGYDVFLIDLFVYSLCVLL